MATASSVLRWYPRLHTGPFLFLTTGPFPPRRSLRVPLFSTVCTPRLTGHAAVFDPSLPFPYGPSLRKGSRPPPPPPAPGGDEKGGDELPAVVDRGSFARVFDIAAVRVPAECCAALESRLRGHLLNWPRVRNVARVPGDEVDPEIAGLLREGGGREDRLRPVLQGVHGEPGGEDVGEGALSPVLYREKLVKEFNCRGFVKFRNLAKISRPKKKKRRKEGEDGEGVDAKSRGGKGEFYTVEVVEVFGDEGRKQDKDEDWSRLLGDDFGKRRWTGSTRLLLLDERYTNKAMEELPEAVKVP